MQVKLFDIFSDFFIFLKLKSANNSSRLVQLKLSDFAVKVKVVSKFGSPVICANLEISNIIIDGRQWNVVKAFLIFKNLEEIQNVTTIGVKKK